MNAAAAFLDSLILDPITVNIQVGWQEDQGQPLFGNDIGLGGPTDGTHLSYAQLRSDLASKVTSSTDALALANLPLTDPTNGGSFYVSSAEEKALGLINPNGTAIDGAVGFGGTATFSFDPNNRAIPNEIDFIGVAEHEITHAMGRTAGLQEDNFNEYTPLDLFRYAAPGTRQLGPGLPAYFSVDNGNTSLNNFDTSSDPGDWASSNSGDAFDSVAYSGVANVISQSDIDSMDVIGFTVTGTSEPLTIAGTVANQAVIDQSTITPFSKVTVSDQNNNQTENVTITLSSAANGTLTNLGGGSYDANTGVYTFSGSIAAINAAVDGLVFVPTPNQIAAGRSVTTSFAIKISDTAGASASDTATSVVAVSSGSAGGTTPLKSVAEPSGSSFTDSGTVTFGATPVNWTGHATVANSPSPVNWTAYSGTMAQEILASKSSVASDIPSVQFTNPTLTTLGLPFNATGLSVWGDPANSANALFATDTIAYVFSSPAPAGTPFLLWAPGAGAHGDFGPFTFSFSASLHGMPTSTAGWSFSVQNPFGVMPTATYTTNPTTGQITVSNYNENLFPDAVIVVTPNTAVDSLQVTASTIPFDFWGLAFPTAPVSGPPNLTGPATVTGVGGATLSLPIDTPTNLALLQPLLTNVSNGVVAGSILPSLTGSPPTIPGGKSGLLQIDSAGLLGMPANYHTAIDDATDPVTLFGGASNGQLVAAGKGGLIFSAGSGAGSVFAGGGSNVAFVNPGNGSQFIALGSGNDTISASAGDDTISGGSGSNLIFLGAGADSVTTGGNDTVLGATGNATVSANGPSLLFAGSGAIDYTVGSAGAATLVGGSGASTITANGDALFFAKTSAANVLVGSAGSATMVGGSAPGTVTANGDALVFNGSGAMTFLSGAGNLTVVGSAAGSTTLFGGSGSMLAFAFGPTRYVGGSGSDTVAGFGGQMTVTGGSGSGVFFGSTVGGNIISAGSGPATILGGGNGDVLGAHGTGSALIAAGPGAETISGLGSSGSNAFFGGSGSDLMLAGSGTTTLVDGTGSDTMTAGSGLDLFAFTAGHHASVVVQNFSAAHDFLSLQGFGGGERNAALAGATVSNGSETIGLSDGTRVTFLNFTGLQASSFI